MAQVGRNVACLILLRMGAGTDAEAEQGAMPGDWAVQVGSGGILGPHFRSHSLPHVDIPSFGCVGLHGASILFGAIECHGRH